jgi:hypothetical protein
MKTTNVILIGVVGIGAVGAYMYMKNKKAQDNLLSGSLPATTPSGTPPKGTPPKGNAPSGTPPVLSTESDGVNPSDANLNLANATVLVGKRTVLYAKMKAPFIKRPQIRDSWTGMLSDSGFGDYARGVQSAQKGIVEIDKKLANLGYKVDATGSLVRI